MNLVSGFAVFAHSKKKSQCVVISMHVNKSPRGSDYTVKSKNTSLGQDITVLMHIMMTGHIKSPELK